MENQPSELQLASWKENERSRILRLLFFAESICGLHVSIPFTATSEAYHLQTEARLIRLLMFSKMETNSLNPISSEASMIEHILRIIHKNESVKTYKLPKVTISTYYEAWATLTRLVMEFEPDSFINSPDVAPLHHVRHILTKLSVKLKICPPIQPLSLETCAAWAVLIVTLNFEEKLFEPCPQPSRLPFYNEKWNGAAEKDIEEFETDIPILLG